MEPEKQSLSQALDPWWQLFPAWEFAGSQMGSIPAEGPRSVLNEEGAFLGRERNKSWQVGGLRYSSDGHLCVPGIRDQPQLQRASP